MNATRELGLSSGEVAERVGMTFRQLDYWTRTRAVTPSLETGRGSGSHRRWSLDDVAALAAISAVANDLASLHNGATGMPLELVARLWAAWQAAEPGDPVWLEAGTITIALR